MDMKQTTFAVRSGLMGGKVTIYGTEQCPWTVKQRQAFDDKGIAYDFVDCSTEQCPRSVKGYPTVKGYGKKWTGFRELD